MTSAEEKPARIIIVKLRMFSHPWRGEGRREHSYYVGHDAGGLSEPMDEIAVDPTRTFLELRQSIEERCDGNVMLRRTFFTEFLHLMQRCRNPHGYEGELMRAYRLGVLRAKATTTTSTSTDRCNIFDIFVEPIMLLVKYLANPRDISRTITHRRCQHIVEEVCGVAMVVGASTWTLSSWFGPPNA